MRLFNISPAQYATH